MLAEKLGKAWAARRASTAIDSVMRFSDEGLVLGAGTVLAPSRGSGRDISLDPGDPRLQALLSAAHLRQPASSDLAHLRKAAQRWRDGEDALASMHLVLSRQDRLLQPEADAHRLFLADNLLSRGVATSAIFTACESGGDAFDELVKTYNPEQPRVSAGNGIISGRWTSTGEGSTQAASQRGPSSNASLTTVSVVTRHVGDDSCHRATHDCIYHAGQGPRGTLRDRIVDATDVATCVLTGDGCEAISFTVDKIPDIYDGGALFGDGGLVIMRKGFEDVYIPSRRYPPVPR